MQGKHIFNIALSCSLLWHIVGFQAINIIWPDCLIPPKFATVNFWGVLLDSQEKDSVSEEIAVGIEEVNSVNINAGEKVPLPLSELSQKAMPESAADIFTSNNFLITEQFREGFKRGIMQKPPLPSCPAWARELSSAFEIELKFLILPDGTVSNVEKNTSSGYPEVDEIGVRYIRRWKFIPITEDVLQKEEWGIIKLLFKLQ
ncbi:MAG: TonB family protein [PVC group bacterium]|nr:TonB family protein [PVC group bacterium]